MRYVLAVALGKVVTQTTLKVRAVTHIYATLQRTNEYCVVTAIGT